MTYPQASTPDPSVHYSEPVSSAQLAFAASELEAIGQNLLAGFLRQVVLGFLGAVTGQSLPGLLSELSSFSNSLQSDISGAVSELQALVSGVSGTAISDVVAVLQMVQQTLDAIANALGQSGSGHSVGEIQAYLGEIPGANIAGALNTAVTLQGQALSSLFNSSGHFIGALDAAATGSLNSAITFGGSALSTVLGGIDAATGDFTGTVTGVVADAATIAGQEASTVQANAQGAVNSIVGGFTNAAVTADQDAAGAQAAITSALTGWFNSWAGQTASSVAASDVAAAAAASVTTANTHTVSINAIQQQLPSFYGGSGTGGFSVSQSFSGSLPSGFTELASGTTSAGAAVMYDTASNADSQTVSGAWTTSDGKAKYLYLRANSGFTTYVFAKLMANDPVSGADNCELGCVVGGTKTVFATFGLPAPGTMNSSSAYSLAAVDYVFTVSGPSGLNVTYTDSSEVSQLGSGYRYAGFGTDGWVRETYTNFTPGAVSFTPPSWADVFDGLVAGAGGGGQGGSGTEFGEGGGYAGVQEFTGLTAAAAGSGAWTGTIASGGAQGAPNGGAGGTGGTTTVTLPAGTVLTAAGGYGGSVLGGAAGGGGIGNLSIDNTLFACGAAQNTANWGGNAPGGGGAGGGDALSYGGTTYPGGPGGAGGLFVNSIDTTAPGSLSYWGFYDNASAGPASAFVATAESTTSDTYTQLTTTTDQVTVNIGSSGMALVFINANMGNNGWQSLMGYAISGATTKPASNDRSIAYQNPGTATNNTFTLGAPFLETGLTPGSTIFEAQYCTSTSGFTATFTDRRIAVIPL